MSKRYEWPERWPGAYIDLPDEWKGKHSRIRREAVEAFEAAGMTEDDELRSFGVALRVVDDFSLPGLDGPERNWDIEELPLGLIKGVNVIVWTSYHSTAFVPKASSEPSQPGPEAATEKVATAGSSEQTN